MEIPLNLIAQSLDGFCVCYFKHIDFDQAAPPHFYVTVPINDDASLLLCIITSQIENKIWYYHRKDTDEAISCLIQVNSNDFSFLNRDSVIDCNQPTLIYKNDLGKIVDQKHGFQIIKRGMPVEIQEKILKAIIDSPLVKPVIKKILLPL